ncbi:MAG: Gfo/Idh/MocA family oxidoreductase [Planctomycetota bacterium]
MSKITIGLIGTGDILDCHLCALRANPDYKLIGICRRSPEKLKAQAMELGVKGYTDYHDLLACRPDVVLISLPHNLHYQAALDAIDVGCHIMMEKPIACSMNKVNGMITAAEEARKVIMVTESSYWLPSYRTARKIVQSGLLGKLLFGSFTNYRFYFNDDRPNWFLQSETSGGGQFINLGVHRTAAVRCIIGDDYYEEVAVMASVHRNHPQYDIESATKAMVIYAEGQAVTYEECGYYHPPAELPQGLHFVFEKGILGIKNDCVWTSDKDGNVTHYELLGEHTGGAYGVIYGQMLKAMDGRAHYPTVRHAAKDVRIALAAYASAEKKKTINLRDSEWTIPQ